MLTRNSFIISKEERIIIVLSLFGNSVNVTKSSLELKAEQQGIPRGASFDHLLTDAQSLGLISNGRGFSITELGKRILNNKEDRSLWKQAYLNVPLYKEYYEYLGHDMNYTSFIRYVYGKYSVSRQFRKWLGMATRRFFKGFYEMELPPKLKQPNLTARRLTKRQLNVNKEFFDKSQPTLNEELAKPNLKEVSQTINSDDKFTMDEYIKLDNSIKELIDTFGLTNFKKFIEKKYYSP